MRRRSILVRQQLARWNDLFGLTWTRPKQTNDGRDTAFVHLQLNLVALTGHKRHEFADVLGRTMIRPIVDQEFAVEPQPNAIIRDGVERVILGELRHDMATPPDGEKVRLDGWIR